MTRKVNISWRLLALLAGITAITANPVMAGDLSPAQQTIATAAEKQQFGFILFYRKHDAATQGMHRILESTISSRQDAAIVAVQVGDAAESALVEEFDATRLPLPAVAVLAPNGAVTGVFPQRVTPEQLTATIVSKAQAACLKALQDQQLVLLCVQPEGQDSTPDGVREFQADELFRDRTQLVSVQATDPAEQKFLRQLDVPTDQPTPVIAFMAPPGVMLGTYKSNVTHAVLAQRLAAAGKCCNDPNCKHHRSADGKASSPR